MNFNRGQLVQALAEFFGIKGGTNTDLSSIIQPVVLLGDAADSPYLRYGIPVARAGSRSAVAAEFGYLGARPGAQQALQITAISISNGTAAAQVGSFRVLTAANIATLGIGTPVNMLSLAPREEGAGTLRPSQIVDGTHTTAALGTSFDQWRVAAGEKILIPLPTPGVILYGDDPGGVPGVFVVNDTANEALVAGFYGREWPLPG